MEHLHAVIKDGKVINVIVADAETVETLKTAFPGASLIDITDLPHRPGVGWDHDGEKFKPLVGAAVPPRALVTTDWAMVTFLAPGVETVTESPLRYRVLGGEVQIVGTLTGNPEGEEIAHIPASLAPRFDHVDGPVLVDSDGVIHHTKFTPSGTHLSISYFI